MPSPHFGPPVEADRHLAWTPPDDRPFRHPTRSRDEVDIDESRSERLGVEHRLRSSRDFALVKAQGTAFRGQHCLMVVLARPGEVTRFGFIASKKGVGGAVQRNRARRRLREIIRRRWPRLPVLGYWITVIAFRTAVTAEHQELATDVERLLASAGALAPIDDTLH